LAIREEIGKYCHSFAAIKRSSAFAANVVEVIESERATDLLGILGQLSMILSSLLQLNAVASQPQASLGLSYSNVQLLLKNSLVKPGTLARYAIFAGFSL